MPYLITYQYTPYRCQPITKNKIVTNPSAWLLRSIKKAQERNASLVILNSLSVDDERTAEKISELTNSPEDYV
jgi:hypothetical protein